MDLTSRDINEKQFHDAWRGYDQEEVDDFLDRVAEVLERVQRENAALQERTRELEQATATSKEREEMLTKTLLTAQQAADEAIAKATARAEQMITEAEERARRANDEANERISSAEAEIRRKSLEAQAEAKRRSEELDRDHAARRRELDAAIEKLAALETELKQRLRGFLEQQVRALDALTERDPTPPRGVRPNDLRAHPSARRPLGPQGAQDAVTQPSVPVPREEDENPEPREGSPRDGIRLPEEEGTPAGHRRGVRGLFWRDEA